MSLIFNTKHKITLKKFVPFIFTTHRIDCFMNFITQNPTDLNARNVMFESVKPRLQEKKNFLEDNEFYFLNVVHVLFMLLAKMEAK